MKLLAILTLMLSSCVAGYGPGWAGAAVATDAEKLDIGSTGIHATKLVQSTGAKELRKNLIHSAIVGAAAGPLASGIGSAIKTSVTP